MGMQMHRGHAVVAALVLLTTVTAASPTGYWDYRCDGGNYTASSKYHQNLEQLSATLPEAVSTSPTLFHTQAVGSSHDRAYALASCRGGTEADCKRCLTQAFKDAWAVCTLRSVSIYYDTCSLGIADKNITIHLGYLHSVLRADGAPIPAQCKALKKDASTLITYVARKAADSPERNATGEKEHDERDCKLKLYSLADCLPGISAAQCHACLEELTSLPGLSSGQMGERKANLWCSYRLEPYQFFKDTKGHKSKTVWIVVGVAGGAVLLAIALLLWWWLLAKRPSAIDSFNKITTNWQGKTIALFLDYDGTLAPKVDNPDEAYMSSEARERLEEAIKEIKGASIEHKKFGISVHYRCVEEEEQELVKKLAKQTIKGFSELTVTKGDKVVEVRPKAEFNKGFAVKYILEQLARKNNWDSSQVVAIFIGDDKTDEDAFKVLRKRVGGLGILVNKKRKWTKA
ncbi:hypothetical protein ACQJBY_072819 [Aegilops geniculata]